MLPDGCACTAAGVTGATGAVGSVRSHAQPTTHLVHGIEHKHDAASLPAEVTAMIDALTMDDRSLYVAALSKVRHQVRAVEREAKVRISCGQNAIPA